MVGSCVVFEYLLIFELMRTQFNMFLFLTAWLFGMMGFMFYVKLIYKDGKNGLVKQLRV